MFQLTKQIDAMTQQVIQLTQGVAAADGQADALGDQVDAVLEQRDSSCLLQADQEALADDAKAAQELNPKPIRLEVADVDIVSSPGTITRVNGVRAATLTAGVEGGDLSTTTAEVKGRPRRAGPARRRHRARRRRHRGSRRRSASWASRWSSPCSWST